MLQCNMNMPRCALTLVCAVATLRPQLVGTVEIWQKIAEDWRSRSSAFTFTGEELRGVFTGLWNAYKREKPLPGNYPDKESLTKMKAKLGYIESLWAGQGRPDGGAGGKSSMQVFITPEGVNHMLELGE